jgi:hypothetical protein
VRKRFVKADVRTRHAPGVLLRFGGEGGFEVGVALPSTSSWRRWPPARPPRQQQGRPFVRSGG